MQTSHSPAFLLLFPASVQARAEREQIVVVQNVQADWIAIARRQMRDLGSLSIREQSGKIKLTSDQRKNGGRQSSVVLPFRWSDQDWGDAYVRIRNIYSLMKKGHDLKSAAYISEGKAPKLVEQRIWQVYMDKYKHLKLHRGTTIQEKTWNNEHKAVIENAVKLLSSSNPPTNPEDLIEACTEETVPGSRRRQQLVRNLTAFLKYCVERQNVPNTWMPKSTKDLIGRKPKNYDSGKQSDPLSDIEILELLESLVTWGGGQGKNVKKGTRNKSEGNEAWTNAIKLMAEYGLRPIELKYLSVKTDLKTKENYLWCSYEKRAGGGVTRPRKLFPIPLTDKEGSRVNWDLLEKLKKKKLILPTFGPEERVALRVRTFLVRQPGWIKICKKGAESNRVFTTYSFRHGFSVRGHELNIASGNMAMAMGHSIETHNRSYPWSTQSGVDAAFANIM